MPNPNTHLKKGKVVFCHILAPPPPQTFWSLPRLVSKFRKKRTPPNLPCQIQIRTRKKERSSSVISWQWRLVSKNRKRRTTHNLPCRVQLRTQKMERSSSVISRQRRLVSKNRKRHTPPNLPCRVQLRTQKWKGRLPTYLGNEGSYQKTVKCVPP